MGPWDKLVCALCSIVNRVRPAITREKKKRRIVGVTFLGGTNDVLYNINDKTKRIITRINPGEMVSISTSMLSCPAIAWVLRMAGSWLWECRLLLASHMRGGIENPWHD